MVSSLICCLMCVCVCVVGFCSGTRIRRLSASRWWSSGPAISSSSDFGASIGNREFESISSSNWKKGLIKQKKGTLLGLCFGFFVFIIVCDWFSFTDC